MARIRCSTSSKSKVESTAWPASYRTAILFIAQEYRNVKKWIAEVPKVTCSPSVRNQSWPTSTVAPCELTHRLRDRGRSPRLCRDRTGRAGGAADETKARKKSRPG